MQRHLKCWLWRLPSLLWAEHKFKCGITGLRKAENMSMAMLVLVARAPQQPIKTLKQWRKWFLDNRRITIKQVADDIAISFGSWQAIFTDVLGMKHGAAKIVQKIAKFWAKTTCHGHRSRDVGDVTAEESWM